MQGNSPTRCLDKILASTGDIWEALRGKSIFITGGTGFFGRWLLESFARANDIYRLNASVLVLTRNCDVFKTKAPHLAENPAIKFHHGDVRDFDFPDGEYSYVIHAATTSAVATFNNEDPLVKFDTVVEGTRRTLDFAVQCQARKFLLTSSGSAYGKLPTGMTHIPEEYGGAPDPVVLDSALGEGKRAAEFLCAYYSKKYGLETKIGRCFSFVGPHLPLDIHYAIGNFIRDAIHANTITVNGDGSPVRSYLYIGDLVTWLLTLLVKGRSGCIYNVGSDMPISIHDLAYLVRDTLCPAKPVRIHGRSDIGVGGNWYVPSIQRARNELGLDVWTPLRDAIRLTAEAADS